MGSAQLAYTRNSPIDYVICELADERFDPLELVFREHLSPECYGVVRLWTGLGGGDGIILAFINTFDQNLEILSAAYS